MIYLLYAILSVLFVAAFVLGIWLAVYGLDNHTIKEPIAAVLILIGLLTAIYAGIDTLDRPEDHCGVGTTYTELSNDKWYCKADKDY